MNLIIGALPYFVVPLVISFVLVPLSKMVGFKLGIYAEENHRTVHEGKIVRMGGVAVFIAFYISMAIWVQADDKINGILLGGLFVFIGGLLDDIFSLKPVIKLGFEVAGALIVLFIGNVYLTTINLPFNIVITNPYFCGFVSFVWIVGVTNAINLIDGLDGLSTGISFIVVCTIGVLGYFMGRRDICILSLIAAGSLLGFLPYNFHPASIFLGDCGAQFLGFLIACISLLGFKTTTMITLSFPILVCFVPIADTLIAIVRRKLKGQKISEADRGHLHHILMYQLNLGHRNTVLLLYVVTILFGGSAILLYFNPKVGAIVTFVLIVVAELFIEKTGMINSKFHPLMGLFRRITFQKKKEENITDVK